jgi:succinate dehydrogenase / fumarate reductase membrane anchor subunit
MVVGNNDGLRACKHRPYLGVQVVIEDYVHSLGLKLVASLLSRFAHIFFAIVGLFAILKLGVGA